MQVLLRQAVMGNKDLGQPHLHPFSIAIPLFKKAPFNCSFILHIYFFCFRSLLASSCITFPTLQQARPPTGPKQKLTSAEKTLRAKILMICINALKVFTFYLIAANAVLVQVQIKLLE